MEVKTLSRTDIILQAIRKRLDEQRAVIDRAPDLGEVTFCVKLNAGTMHVRSVLYSEERVNRRDPIIDRRAAAR